MKGIKYLNENYINDRRISNKTGTAYYQLSLILDDFAESQNKELIEANTHLKNTLSCIVGGCHP